jgi:hypothetical protein
MRKLIFILLAFLAAFTFIRAYEEPEGSVTSARAEISVEIGHQ